MKSDEGLDVLTVMFAAEVLKALGSKISKPRMEELINNPEKLQALLIPLFNDDSISLLSTMSYFVRQPDIVQFSITSWGSGCPPVVRAVMKEAYERKLAPLEKEEAQELCNIMCEANNMVCKSVGAFPYLENKKVHAFICVLGHSDIVDYGEINLDKIDERLASMPFFFVHGYHDRSNCFKIK